jgi:RNAse (barnase) inhibitor barstar
MLFNPRVFKFEDEHAGDANAAFVASLPSGLRAREALFAALSRALNLPSYFGANWDALSDCLRDLSWIAERRIVLLHTEFPSLDDRELTSYLSVLADCILDWGTGGEHELVVVLPADVRDVVAHLAEQGGV